MQDIVVGRSKKNFEKFGLRGSIYLGKHYIKMGPTHSLSNKIYLDVAGAHVVFICGKRGGGKCLTGDTLITLNDGREIPLKELEHNDNAIVALNDDLKLQTSEKSEFFKRTVDKILKITLRSGKELSLTHEHPLLTVSGWIPAEELSVGSRIATPRHLVAFGEKDLSEERVKILAYLLAEGPLHDEILSNDFNKVINDKELLKERIIPNNIFQLPRHKLSLFLNRLFSCDGSIYAESNRWRISYASSSKRMIYQVQSLLLKFGLLSRVREKSINNFISYELELQEQYIHEFIQEIGFFGKKQERQEKALLETKKNNPNVDTIPKEIRDSYRPKNWVEAGKALNYKSPKSLRSSINYSPSRQKLQTIALVDDNEYVQKLATSDIFWDEIVCVEESHEQTEVYDICVPEQHNFVANGVIVHNSYTMGVIAEGFHLLEKAIKQNLSVILLDTMGIYWTMKYPNEQDKLLLEEWGLKPENIPVKIFTPEKYYNIYKKQGIPTDVPFTLLPSAIDSDDWCLAFKLDKYSAKGVLINKTVNELKKQRDDFIIADIVSELQKDTEADAVTKDGVISMFKMADNWGVFSDHGTPLSDVAKGGQITVLDVSCYATMPGGWDVKALMIGLIAKQLFVERMVARKDEEYENVENAFNYFSRDVVEKQKMPLVWLVIDEAHEFLPREGKVASTDALVTVMREGRQPGLSLILATQQPGKIHTDVMTQSDTVLSHRITAKIDVDALGVLMQSYMREGLVEQLDNLPREMGAGILFDDNNEKMYPIRVRPRFTWHGGASPTAIPPKKEDEEDFL